MRLRQRLLVLAAGAFLGPAGRRAETETAHTGTAGEAEEAPTAWERRQMHSGARATSGGHRRLAEEAVHRTRSLRGRA